MTFSLTFFSQKKDLVPAQIYINFTEKQNPHTINCTMSDHDIFKSKRQYMTQAAAPKCCRLYAVILLIRRMLR